MAWTIKSQQWLLLLLGGSKRFQQEKSSQNKISKSATCHIACSTFRSSIFPVFRELPPLLVTPFHTLQKNSDEDTVQSDSEIQMDGQFDVCPDDSCISLESDCEHSQEPSTHISQSLPQTINQFELNDVIRDLNLSKDQSQILASRLKEKNLLTYGRSVSYNKSRESSFRQFFKVEDPFVFCSNVESLLVQLGIENYGA